MGTHVHSASKVEEIMRYSSFVHRPVRAIHVAIVVAMLAIVTDIGTPQVATAATPTPWIGIGPATVTTVSDGSLAPPQMTYNLVDSPLDIRFSDNAWTLQTEADGDFSGSVPYVYTGFHAYFDVTAHVDAFVIHDGATTLFPLVNAGPSDCYDPCLPPSAGFSYSGSYAFNVEDGDTYGFKVGGQNYDSNPLFTGTLTLATSVPPYTDPAAVASNTSWTTAAPLTAAGLDGTLSQPGEARWYKFPVQPASQVQVDLTNLDQNFDITMFRDIGQAFTTLTTVQDLTKLSAQFASDAYSPSIYSPSIYSPSIYSPSIYSPSIYSPSIYSPSIYSPSIYSPSIYSPSIYSPSIYSPSIYSPSIYSPSIYSPSDAFLQAFSSAQTRSLIGVSAHENAEAESIRTATWNNTGDYYVRVQGRNGASSPTPFHLGLTTAGGPCTGITLNSFSSLDNPLGIPGSAEAVILTDSSRLAPTTTLTTALDELKSRTNGVVVNLTASPRIQALNAQADLYKACPYAKNLVAEAIREVVNSYRDTVGTLKYVVIIGGDLVVPFFRYADSAGIGPESDYEPPAANDSAAQASLRSNYVLGQDAYGAVSDLTVKGAVLPVPDLAVGRLVETPDEITGMINAYLGLNNGTLPTPTSSLVTGYDFLTSAADSVQADFASGLGSSTNAKALITDQGIPTTSTTVAGTPTRDRSWTATDLSNSLLGSHHDLVFLAGHFSAFSALAADYRTSITTTDLDAHPNVLTNSLVISAGCHAGYNLLDTEAVPGLTQGVADWPEAMAKQRATLIAGTGYQYADTDFLAYSAKLYALLATQLREGSGAVPLGQALVNAKQDYLASIGNLTGIDQKALIESTLYGLPMTGLNLPSGRTPTPADGAGVITPTLVGAGTPGVQLGLKTAPFTVNPGLGDPVTKPVLNTAGIPTGPSFSWFVGHDGVQSQPGAPALPKQIDDVTSTTGEVLRGVGFVSGTYGDRPGVTPLTGAPTTEQNGIHTDFVSPVFFPQKLATVNYFGALDGNGTDGRTRLITTPVQYRSDPGTTSTNTERKYSNLGLELFYSANVSVYGANTPALAAPPSISGVSDVVLPLAGGVKVSAHITGDPSAGIQKVWVTYTAEHGPLYGGWQSVILTQDPVDSTLWTGTFALPSGQSVADVRYVVQAVNGVGLVGLDNNLGDGYTPGQVVESVPPAGLATTITLGPTAATGVVGTSLAVTATLGGAPAGSEVTFSLGSASATASTNGAGLATATLPLQDAVGSYTLSASYAGDLTHKSSTATRPFGIVKVPTVLTAPGIASGTVSSALKRSASGSPVPQQSVMFTLTGPVVKKFTATTDPQGQAIASTGVLPDGAYTVSAEFLGTPSTFLPSSASSSTTFDTTGPVLSAVKLTPPSIVLGATTKLTAAVVDTAGVARVEYFVGADPGRGLATAITPVSGAYSATFGANLPVGTYTVSMRARDNLGNWSAISTVTLTVVQMGLSVSTNASRTGPVDFAGSTVSGNIAVFATPATNSSRVVLMGFYFDDPNRTAVPYWIQLLSPFDLNGTAKNGTANLFDTRLLPNGAHTLTVELLRLNGSLERRSVTFTVNNPAPTVSQKLQVSTTATRANPVDLNGRTLTGSVAIFVTPTTSVKSVAFWLDKPAVLPRSIDTSAQFDFNGTANNGQAILFNVGTLAAGSHRISALVTYTNGTTAVISSTFTK
jgi:hypothetical protein